MNERCSRCGHDAEIHALDGRGIVPDPYCEEDSCACTRYQLSIAQEAEAAREAREGE